MKGIHFYTEGICPRQLLLTKCVLTFSYLYKTTKITPPEHFLLKYRRMMRQQKNTAYHSKLCYLEVSQLFKDNRRIKKRMGRMDDMTW